MKIELSMIEMIKILKSASLGKLMTGLIHNINSPLQNVGMDIELVSMLLKNTNQSSSELIEKLIFRLDRMDSEFGRINQILKSGTINFQLDEYYLKSLTLNLFLQQALKMLEANLYFKHNVKTEVDLKPDLSKPSDRSENFWFALIWFMQAIVDNMEKNEIKELVIKTDENGTGQKLLFQLKEGKLSNGFLQSLNKEKPLTNHLEVNEDAMLAVALHILRSDSVVINAISSNSVTDITLDIIYL